MNMPQSKNVSFQMTANGKIRCAILGATGLVGQGFVSLLNDHPWFDLVVLASSERSNGRRFGECAKWNLPSPAPARFQDFQLTACNPDELERQGVKVVFSALPESIASVFEPILRARGFYVFSNASALRYHDDVPILIPEINSSSLDLIKAQGFPAKGFVVTNSNCTVSGLALALAPLRSFGITKITVSTYQSLSGAGLPGQSALEMSNNLVPFIYGEEEKMKRESGKILEIRPDFAATCVRVPVSYGHIEAVWVDFENRISEGDIIGSWNSFIYEDHRLPTLPMRPIEYLSQSDRPQPSMAFWGEPSGMTVYIGRLRVEKNRARFVILVNNLIRGSAGGSIANAELFKSLYGDNL